MPPDKIALQRAEFDAYKELAKQWGRLEMTAIVDDDYLAVRRDYERALEAFLLACAFNRPVKMAVTEAPARTDSFLATLRAANLSRVVRFGHGDIKALHGWGPMQWGCALAGEVGELCNFLKKYERQMPSDPSLEDLSIEIAGEIADVLIYLDLLAAYFDFDLTRVVTTKFNRTSKAKGFPERL
jgi:NTP pyrophosphatase (non-canonical NTP hydrolase)